MKSPCKYCVSNICECPVDRVNDHNEGNMDNWCPKVTSDKKWKCKKYQNAYSSPLQTIRESECLQESSDLKTYTPSCKFTDVPSNPFDEEIDSLHLSSFSPSVFASFSKQEVRDASGKSFCWSIDQLAVLTPADIDESSQLVSCTDSEKEIQAQKAIDVFFAKNHFVPSPWTPSPKFIGSSFQKGDGIIGLSSKVEKIKVKSSLAKTSISEENEHCKEVSTQTQLTIPPCLDVSALLGRFFTYIDEDNVKEPSNSSISDVDMLSTSSLRRKLFLNTEYDLSSPCKDDKRKSSDLLTCTPETKGGNWCITPASDLFSSSPITPRNCSISISCAGHTMASPPISPICISDTKDSDANEKKCDEETQNETPETELNYPVMQKEMNSQEDMSTKEIGTSVFVDDNMNSQEEAMASCYSRELESQETESNAISNVCLDSCSAQKDTGYLTGSINSMGSLGSYHFSCMAQSRITPVMELLDDCIISNKQQQFLESDAVSCIDNSVMSCDANDSGLSEMVCSREQKINFSTFSEVPWQPNKCSTPTKNFANTECN